MRRRLQWLFLIGMCVCFGDATGAPGDAPKLDSKLTAAGKKWAAQMKKQMDSTDGRMTKEQWATAMGRKDDPAYKAARTHMPRGMGLGVRFEAAAEVDQARKAARAEALARAKRQLAARGAKVSDADAARLIDEENAKVKEINKRLAAQRDALAALAKDGKQAEMAQAMRAVLEGGASGSPAAGPLQGATAEERDLMNREVITFQNRMAAKGGAK